MQVEGEGPEWQNIPLGPLSRIMFYCDAPNLCSAVQVCATWSLAEKEGPWIWMCESVGANDFVKDVSDAKAVYKCWWKQFHGTDPVMYEILKNLYDKLQRCLEAHSLELSLMSGMPIEVMAKCEEELEKFCNDAGLPADIKTWYLMTQGQDLERGISGLFGGYSFYSQEVNMLFLPLAYSITKARRNILPFCFDAQGQSAYYVVLSDSQVGSVRATRGNILAPSMGNDFYLVATNFTALLHNHLMNWESGNYQVRDDIINLFPTKNIPTATTHGVTIEASPLFIRELSTPGGRQFWSYSIHMFMDASLPQGIHDCQLVSRHWEIESNDEIEVVDGPGVIGKYPKMFPGAEFQYESCCPLETTSGFMSGSFQMRRVDGSVFDAEVPRFEFKVPQVLEYTLPI